MSIVNRTGRKNSILTLCLFFFFIPCKERSFLEPPMLGVENLFHSYFFLLLSKQIFGLSTWNRCFLHNTKFVCLKVQRAQNTEKKTLGQKFSIK